LIFQVELRGLKAPTAHLKERCICGSRVPNAKQYAKSACRANAGEKNQTMRR
jgi:hypothetical protein